MSRENVGIVRRVYDAAARRYAATVLGSYDPKVEWDVSRSPMARLVGEGVYYGHQGLRRFFRAYHAVWTVRDGKIVRVAWFETRAEALEAAGLRE